MAIYENRYLKAKTLLLRKFCTSAYFQKYGDFQDPAVSGLAASTRCHERGRRRGAQRARAGHHLHRSPNCFRTAASVTVGASSNVSLDPRCCKAGGQNCKMLTSKRAAKTARAGVSRRRSGLGATAAAFQFFRHRAR